MPEPVKAEAILHQYMVMQLNGGPTIAPGTTTLDGKRVHHCDDKNYTGIVLGPSVIDDFIWVRWEPEGMDPRFGVHRQTDVIEVPGQSDPGQQEPQQEPEPARRRWFSWRKKRRTSDG